MSDTCESNPWAPASRALRYRGPSPVSSLPRIPGENGADSVAAPARRAIAAAAVSAC